MNEGVESSKSLADGRSTEDSKKPPVVYIATVNVTAQGIAPLPKDGSEEQLQEAYPLTRWCPQLGAKSRNTRIRRTSVPKHQVNESLLFASPYR